MWILCFALALLFGFKWIKWKISTLALIYYIEKNQYKQPDSNDMKECTDFVAKNIIKDLTGR